MADLIGQTIGNYRVEALLGRGGMGAVYRATHRELSRPAAIKVMHPHLAADQEFQARFRHEARAAAALNHPNIIDIYEFGEQDGLFYLIMQLVPDGSIRALFADAQRDPAALVLGLDLIRQAAEGLAYAHRRHMVHRDIKPDNLLLERLDEGDGPAYRLYICDFGITRLTESSVLTASGITLGTPAYMSPEQCTSGVLDGRSDQYALGVVLYELTTGRKPFDTRSLGDAVYQHVHLAPPPPSQLRPDMPGGLEHLILRCLAKQPDQRYPSCTDLAHALEAVSSGARARLGLATLPPAAFAVEPTPTARDSQLPVVSAPAADVPPPWTSPPAAATPPSADAQPTPQPLPLIPTPTPAPVRQDIPPHPPSEQFAAVPPSASAPSSAATPAGKRRGTTTLIAGIIALLVVVGAAAYALSGRGDDDPPPARTATLGGSNGQPATARATVTVPVGGVFDTAIAMTAVAPTSTQEPTEATTRPAEVTSPPRPILTATSPPPTATPTALPTDTPLPTATPLPGRPADGDVLGEVDFGVFFTGDASWGSASYQDGIFNIKVTLPNQGVYFRDEDFGQFQTNFSATIELRKLLGNDEASGCLMVNLTEQPSDDPAFGNFEAGSVRLCLTGSLVTAFQYRSSDGGNAIDIAEQQVNATAWNSLTITSRGDELWFAINGLAIGYTTIPDRAAGYVAVMSVSGSDTSEFEFTNLIVRAIQ